MKLTHFTGQLEATLTKTSARTANLRAILADDDNVRKTVVEMVNSMASVDKEDVRGFRRAMLLDPTSPEYSLPPHAASFSLDEIQYQLLRNHLQRGLDQDIDLPREALVVQEISTRGVSYASRLKRSGRDSAIIFKPHDEHSRDFHLAGRIEKIFQYTYHIPHNVTGFYLIVREHLPVGSSTFDPYKRFGFAGGYLCEREPTTLHVIALSQVLSHFAATSLTWEDQEDLIHVLPLDRVCSSAQMMLNSHSNIFEQLMLSFQQPQTGVSEGCDD